MRKTTKEASERNTEGGDVMFQGESFVEQPVQTEAWSSEEHCQGLG